MSCPICFNDYVSKSKKESSELADSTNLKCSYIYDNGEICNKPNTPNEDLCNLHAMFRTKITCPSCTKECCRICYRTIFLKNSEEPRCIHCQNGFSIEFLLDKNEDRFTNKFIWGPLKEHRENILLQQLLSRLPIYQHLVTEQIIKEKKKNNIDKINQRLIELEDQNIEIIKTIIIYEEYDMDTYKLYKILNKNKFKIEKLIEYKSDINKSDTPPTIKEEEEEEKQKTHGNCLNSECRGFINHEWECGICFMKVCSKCHSIKNKDHECDPNEIETMKILKEISKPCPGCNQMIEKITGCNMMWCTNCHNFFDWQKLVIIKKTKFAHNPEHIAWMAKNNKTLGNIAEPQADPVVNVCNLDYYKISNLLIPEDDKDMLNEHLRFCNEIRDDIDRYRDPLEKNIEKHAIDYLREKIDKNYLKKLIQRNYKSSKKTELANMYRMLYVDNVQSILVYAVNEIKKYQLQKDNQSKIQEILKNTENVLYNTREYTEKCLQRIGELFNSEKPHLSNISAKVEQSKAKFPTIFLKKLDNLRNKEFYIEWPYRIVLFDLTKSENNDDLIDFLKENPDWIPTHKEIMQSYEKTH